MKMKMSVGDRPHFINKLSSEEFDLVIIGGGISGAGVARDAASRGMKVALIEARDFAEGTSSRSSKLIHGGIRYLENLEFGLVHEALSERSILFEIAPHLVHPLRFLLPVYKDSRVGMFKMGLGMWLYDLLSTFDAPQLHERLNVSDTLRRAPILNAKDLSGSYEYSDAYMDDDRLVIETLRSAASLGATCVNYASAKGAEFAQGKLTSIRCVDHRSQKEFSIRGKHFVSTVGPWTDEVGQKIFGDWKKIMRPSKGVHLTFERSRIPLSRAVVMVSDDQKRIVFAIPRHEMVIIGTTDTDFKDSPEKVKTEQSDVDYLLKVSNEYFPGANIRQEDIVASYAGVRPLVDDGSATESKTSREHLIFTDPRNITFLTGGKYTTYRKMAEETVGKVLESFSADDRVRWGRSRTKEPLNPLATVEEIFKAQSSAEAWSKEFGVDVDTVNNLVDRHGAEARLILEKWSDRFRKAPLAYLKMEAQFALEETMCFGLNDFYLRRVPLFLTRRLHGFEFLEVLGEHFASELCLNSIEKNQMIDAVRQHKSFEMSWRQTSGENGTTLAP